jgi:hypothetical protein
MDRGLYLANAQLAQKGITDYLKACISENTPVETLMKNNMIFGLRGQESGGLEGAGGVEAVVGGNELLGPLERKEMVKNMQEF